MAKRLNKQIGQIVLERKDEYLYLKIKVSEQIEALFKTDNVRTSERWSQVGGNPLKFYEIDYSNPLNAELGYNDFGRPLVREGKTNLAILRTVGLAKGIKFNIPEMCYSQETLEQVVRDLRKTIAKLYKTYCQKCQIKATLSIKEVF